MSVPKSADVVLADSRLNGGSPIGPGFVVYERAEGEKGYSREMALASVGKGWAGLINEVFDRVKWDTEHNQGRFLGGLVIVQVKEKFGTLRMYHYTTNGDEGYMDGFITAIESMSARICEDCGKPGSVRPRSWVRTLCDECYNNGKGKPTAQTEQTE